MELGCEDALPDAGLPQEQDVDRAGGDALEQDPPQLVHRPVPAEHGSVGIPWGSRSPERRVGLLHQERRGPIRRRKLAMPNSARFFPRDRRHRRCARASARAPLQSTRSTWYSRGRSSQHVTGLDHSGELLVCRRSGRPRRADPEHAELVPARTARPHHPRPGSTKYVVRVEAHPPRLGRHTPAEERPGSDRSPPRRRAAARPSPRPRSRPRSACRRRCPGPRPRRDLRGGEDVDAAVRWPGRRAAGRRLAPSNAGAPVPAGPSSTRLQRVRGSSACRSASWSLVSGSRLRVGVHLDSPTARRYLAGHARRSRSAADGCADEHLRPFPQLVPRRPPLSVPLARKAFSSGSSSSRSPCSRTSEACPSPSPRAGGLRSQVHHLPS